MLDLHEFDTLASDPEAHDPEQIADEASLLATVDGWRGHYAAVLGTAPLGDTALYAFCVACGARLTTRTEQIVGECETRCGEAA
jgi:hypothetical protein